MAMVYLTSVTNFNVIMSVNNKHKKKVEKERERQKDRKREGER